MPKYTPVIDNIHTAPHNTVHGGYVPHTEHIAAILSQTPPSTQDITGIMDELGIPQTPDTDQQITRIQQHRDQFDTFINTFYGSIKPTDLDHIQTAQAGLSLASFSGSQGLTMGLAIAVLIAIGGLKLASRYNSTENKVQVRSVGFGRTILRLGIGGATLLILLLVSGSYFGLNNTINQIWGEKEDKEIDTEQEKQEVRTKEEFTSKTQDIVDRLHLHQEFDRAIYRGPGCVFEFEFPGKPGLTLRIETIGGVNQGNVLAYTCTLLQNGQVAAVQLLKRDMTDRLPSLTSSIDVGEFRRGEGNSDKKLPLKLGKATLTRAKVLGSKGGDIRVAGPEPEEDEYNPVINTKIFSSATQDALDALFEKLGGPIPKGTYIMKDEHNNVRVWVQMQNEQRGTITRIIGSNTKMAQIEKVEVSYSGNEINWKYGKMRTNTIEAGKEALLQRRMEAVQTNLQNGNWTLAH